MSFHDVRLPVAVEVGATGGPRFKTTIAETDSGVESRNVDWSRARVGWDVGYGITESDDVESSFEEVQAFFYGRRGRAYGFRFKDWADYTATDVQIGVGDNVEDEFQLVKIYEASGPLPYSRKITRPVADTIVIKLNGVVTAAWTLDPLGVIHFTSPPGTDVVITATFEFDVPVRFDADEFDLTLERVNAGEIPTLPIKEIRE